MLRIKLSTVCALCLIIIACQHMGSGDNYKNVLAEVVYKSHQCNRSDMEPAAAWLDNEEELSLVYKRVRKHIIGSGGMKAPQVDFSKDGLLLVEMGQRPTSGYELDIADEKVLVNKGTVIIKIYRREPERESMLAQVITSPCIMIKLPLGNYSLISIRDQNNEIYTEVNITGK